MTLNISTGIIDAIDKETPVNKNDPYGWIQWKGTDLCMDVHCACGELMHIDGDFCYTIQCPECKRIYAPDPHITLIQISEADAKLIQPDGPKICET